MNEIESIRKVISESNTIIISAHTNPDGDAVGACSALAIALEKIGKDIKVYTEEFGEKYNIIPYSGKIIKSGFENAKADLFIALDCGDKERLRAELRPIFDNTRSVNIDHHSSNIGFADYNYVDSKASSTSELIFRVLDGFIELDSDIAASIYAGLIYDTGAFKHSSTSPYTMKIASELISYNIPFTKIYDTFFESRSFTELKLMGRALERAELAFDGKLIYSYITLNDIAEIGGSNKELDGVVSYLKGVKNTVVSLFLYEKSKNVIKISLRSNENVDVCEFCQKFGGGGHKRASGATIEASFEDAINTVVFELGKTLSEV